MDILQISFMRASGLISDASSAFLNPNMKPRWLFFTLFASYSVPGRFMSIFYQEHQIDDTHIGILMAITPLVTIFCAPLFCNLADRTGRREDVTLAAYAGFIAAFLSQVFAIPSLNLISATNRFPYLFVIRVLLGACYSPSYPLVSAITISHLKQQYGYKGHERFGHERLWGAVSWASCSLILGILLDLVTAKVWLVHGGFLLFGILFLCTLYRFKKENAIYQRPTQSEGIPPCAQTSVGMEREMPDDKEAGDVDCQIENNSHCEDSSISTTQAVSRIMCSDGIVAPVFFNLIFWLAAGMSVVENLLFLFFENELHASNFLCGISVVVTVVVEIPIFAKAPDLLEKLGSSVLAIIGSSSFALRGWGYQLSQNGWMALLNEPLHGITYGTFHTATVAYIAERSPGELEATGQSILEVVKSLGQILGTSSGGYVMQQFGSKVLFRSAALIVLGATLAFGVVDRLSQRSTRGETCLEGGAKTEFNDERMVLTTVGD